MLSGDQRRYGIVLVTVSAVLWSTAGLFVRMADLDAWTVLGWRSLFAALFLTALALYQSARSPGRALWAIGWPGVVSIPITIVSTIAYVFALKLTTVANVMTIYATLPFIATGVAFVWIRERVTARVLIASGVALAGIVVMAGAATAPKDIAGNLAAFVMTVGFGMQLVHAKRHASLNMAVVNALAAWLCAALCWPLMARGIPTLDQLVILAAFGIVTTGLAYIMALVGGRYITSGEAAFISMLDVVLGPLWVWLVFAEQPDTPVLIGGTIVLGAVLWYLNGLRAGATVQPA